MRKCVGCVGGEGSGEGSRGWEDMRLAHVAWILSRCRIATAEPLRLAPFQGLLAAPGHPDRGGDVAHRSIWRMLDLDPADSGAVEDACLYRQAIIGLPVKWP